MDDLFSDSLMLVIVILTITTSAYYAWRYKHIWLGAGVVPLGWLAYYYFLQIFERDNESLGVMLTFRPMLAMLFIFQIFFIARDRVDGGLIALARWMMSLARSLAKRLGEVSRRIRR